MRQVDAKCYSEMSTGCQTDTSETERNSVSYGLSVSSEERHRRGFRNALMVAMYSGNVTLYSVTYISSRDYQTP